LKRLVSDGFSYQSAYLLNCESEEGKELAARATGAIARKKGITKDMVERREEWRTMIHGPTRSRVQSEDDS
jgi:hypothetical protein